MRFHCLLLAPLVIASACTNTHEEEMPVSFGVNMSELVYDADSSLRPVIISSGTKWSVANMPSWISLQSIRPSGVSPYEWVADFVSEANDGYDREGQIVIKANTESAEIAVGQEGKKGKYVAVESISLAPMELSLTEEESASLLYTILPSNASVKEVSWESSSTSVATVSETGEVNAISPGTAQITVTTEDGGKTASCAVTVKTKVIPVSSVSLNKTSLTMTVGDTETLVSTVLPENATDPSVTWSSSNTSVATVSSFGVVTAKAVGSTTITINTNDGSKTATCTVTVNPVLVTGISLNKAFLTLTIGGTEKLTPTIMPSNATNKNVSWSSSDKSVAIVDSNGNVSAIKVGTSVIIATTDDGGKTASCVLTVDPVSVSGVSLNKSSLTMLVGGSETLTATVAPSNATNKRVSWSSSNTNVATVDSNGKVNAVSGGTATITATTEDGGKTASCSVTVNVPVTGVSLNKSSLFIVVGNTELLVATIAPSDATNQSVSWTSSNTSVATVSSSGLVTARAIGDATITVMTADGSKTATCAVTVLPIAVTGVSLNKYSLSMYESDKETLIATVSPTNASNKSVTWSSSNTSVATVSSYGQVTAIGAGSATVTVTTIDGGITASCAITVQSDPYGAVDLGLSVKWASFNYGASSESDIGGYYKWGDPTGTAAGYSFSNPEVDSISGTQYDVVRQNWGGAWRIPTASEIKELRDNCTKTWITVAGVSGVRFTGKTGNSIFLPVSGMGYVSSQTAYSDVKTGITQTNAAILMAGTSYFDTSWDGRVTYLYMFSEDSFYNYLLQRVTNNWSVPIRPVR